MKTISKDTKHIEKAAAVVDQVWNGQQVTCSNCGSVLQLENKDAVKVLSREKTPNGKVTVAFTCGECKQVVNASFRAGVVGKPVTRTISSKAGK